MSSLTRLAFLLPALALATMPAAAQQRPAAPTPPSGGAGWQQGNNVWQPIPGSPQTPAGVTPLPQGNNLAPELNGNYQRMLQQRRLNERVEAGSALILQGVIPRDR